MAGTRFIPEGGLFVPNNASNSTLNTTTVDGSLTVSGNLVVIGTTVQSNTISVVSDTTLSTNNLIVTGIANLSGNVIVGGSTLNVSSNATFTGLTNLTGNVNISGLVVNVFSEVTFANAITFTNNVTYAVPPTITGTQVVGGSIIPSTNNLYALGNTTSVWSSSYLNNIFVYSGNVSVGNTTVNAFVDSTTLRVSNSSSNTIITPSTISIGSATINATNFSGTSNNALYLGGTLAASYATNTSITSSLNAYTGTSNVATLGTVTTGTWNAGTIAANRGGTGNSALSAGIAYAGGGATPFSTATAAQIVSAIGSTQVANATFANTAATLSATLTVSKGGTGVTTLTGVVYGNGTSAFTAASAAQIVSAIGSTQVANATFANTAAALITTNNYRVNSLGVATDASGTSGEIRATGNITAYYSDMRLKKFVNFIDNPLDKLKQLSGFYYTGNEEAGKLGYNTTKTEVGVSAQDVKSVLPEIIQPAPIDPQYMTLDYGRLVPLLIEAIKELCDKVETLERKLEK